MKRIFVAFLCVIVIFSMPLSVLATDNSDISESRDLGNGISVVQELVVYDRSRASERSADLKNNYYYGDTLIAVITMRATFRYDGSTVSVVSKSVTQTDTYDGWSYQQTSFTSSGGTVSLTGKLSKWLILNSTFTMTLTCDKDGNIS